MNENRDFSSRRADRFKERFPKVTKLVADNVIRPFRPRSVINSAMLEGVMVALLEDETVTPQRVAIGYKSLDGDPSFSRLLRGATTDTLTVRERIRRAKEAFGNA